jgi:hypothetical protein
MRKKLTYRNLSIIAYYAVMNENEEKVMRIINIIRSFSSICYTSGREDSHYPLYYHSSWYINPDIKISYNLQNLEYLGSGHINIVYNLINRELKKYIDYNYLAIYFVYHTNFRDLNFLDDLIKRGANNFREIAFFDGQLIYDYFLEKDLYNTNDFRSRYLEIEHDYFE